MNVHFSSAKDDWETPQELFDLLNDEFHFTVDVCATKETAKCDRYYTPQDSALKIPWIGEVCWMNPPYGRQIGHWVAKAGHEGARYNTMVVALLPARTDTQWWWNHCATADEIRFLKGRLKFGGHENSAPFPSAIVVFATRKEAPSMKSRFARITKWWDWKQDIA
jgi:phage N-6-adenine-methyltransferase